MELDLKGLNKDALKFKEIEKNREKIIHGSSANAIPTQFRANELAHLFHPQKQFVKVLDIIEENKKTKTFVLVPDIDQKTKRLAYFQPGQCISIQVFIEDGIYKRPYSISCSPKQVLDNNMYTITIQRKPNGIVSNYFLDHVKIDDKFEISGPFGEFTYEPLRDAKNIIAIVGESGITPILSMAEAIYDGILNCKLTILYGVEKEENILFYKRLEELKNKCRFIQVEYLVSDESKSYYEQFSKDLIDPYLENENSFFVSGPLEMYDYVNTLLKDYHLPKKYIRHDAFFGTVDIRGNDLYQVTVVIKEKEITIPCRARETLLCAMEKHGITTQSHCHVGECGYCRSKLIEGTVKTFNDSIRASDKEFKYIHPCSSFPESDVTIELPF